MPPRPRPAGTSSVLSLAVFSISIQDLECLMNVFVRTQLARGEDADRLPIRPIPSINIECCHTPFLMHLIPFRHTGLFLRVLATGRVYHCGCHGWVVSEVHTHSLNTTLSLTPITT